MWNKIKKEFYFGEEVKGYDVRVLNEREVRAGAGILFLAAFSVFFLGCQGGNLLLVKVFAVYFLVEFIIRVLINPKYAPSLILGRFFVQNQIPEYTGAPQKRFAWTIGLILAVIFFVSAVIFSTISLFNLILCFICLTFLFFESVFGICGGCKIYEKILHKKTKYCPGGTCEVFIKQEIQKISLIQIFILILAISSILFAMTNLKTDNSMDNKNNNLNSCVLNK